MKKIFKSVALQLIVCFILIALAHPVSSADLSYTVPKRISLSVNEVPNFAKLPKVEKTKPRILDIASFYSKYAKNYRGIHVYLPPSYYENTDKHYPVLYMHDGQVVFGPSSNRNGYWDMARVADLLITNKKIQDIIIVAIDRISASERQNELTFWECPNGGTVPGGKGAIYEKFVINEVKPFIDKNFPTLKDAKNTGLMGSSLGGLATLCMGMRHSEIFGKLGVMSPSIWWGTTDTNIATKLDIGGEYHEKKPLKIWFDIGDKEAYSNDLSNKATVANSSIVFSLMLQDGYKNITDMAYYIQHGAEHTSYYWNQRAEYALIYLFGDIGKPVKADLYIPDAIKLETKVQGTLYKIDSILPTITYSSGITAVDFPVGKLSLSSLDIVDIDRTTGIISPKKPGKVTITYTSLSGLKTSRILEVTSEKVDYSPQ